MIDKAHDGSRIITFEGKTKLASKWSYAEMGIRPPKVGEFYLSGAIPQAWRARSDFVKAEYIIVEPVREYRRQSVWLPTAR